MRRGSSPSALTQRRRTFRLVDIAPDADGSDVAVEADGEPVRFRLNAPGRHMAMNALAALAAAAALGARRPGQRRAALEGFAPSPGRGARRPIAVARRHRVLLLDESYNGNAASMRAALACCACNPAQRRIAVLGDMLELGDAGPAEHAALAAEVAAAADLLFACGPLMRDLFDALPAPSRGAHATDSAALAPTGRPSRCARATRSWSRAASAAA